jgi:phospholipid/cholesterol/gamma-HCH transport system substrate-binding protein
MEKFIWKGNPPILTTLQIRPSRPSSHNLGKRKNNMETHTQKFKIRLGLFIAGGIVLFILAIFIIGKQKNLFSPVFKLNTTFYNVSGLQVGNNIRFAGITVGTVDNIDIINDSTVRVEMLIKKDVKKFIKSDCGVRIGSEGLIGDKLLVITQGSSDAPEVREGQAIKSAEPVEMDAIMASLAVTAVNAEVITGELAEIMVNVNSGNGTLGRLIQDSVIAENLSQTIINLKSSTKGLDENMEAAKHNFLLKGYFNKKEKARLEEEKKKAADDKKAAKAREKEGQK